MYLAKGAVMSKPICGFAFLFGGMVGCLVLYLSSDSALSSLSSLLLNGQALETTSICFAAELLIAVFALLLSITAFGLILIPVFDFVIGFYFGIWILLSIYACITSGQLMYGLFMPIPNSMILVYITAQCSEISAKNAEIWTSKGLRTFDLRTRTYGIWLMLIVLLVLSILQSIVLYSTFAIRR